MNNQGDTALRSAYYYCISASYFGPRGADPKELLSTFCY